MVITEFCGSSGFSVPAFAAKAPTLGAPDTYADCAATGATAIKVASVRLKILEIARVYFMPEESNFFMPKWVKGHSQVIRCTPDAEIGPSESAYLLDCRGDAADVPSYKRSTYLVMRSFANPQNSVDSISCRNSVQCKEQRGYDLVTLCMVLLAIRIPCPKYSTCSTIFFLESKQRGRS